MFSCCPASSPTGDPVQFAQKINLLVADNLFRTDATGLRRLVPGDPINVKQLLLEWGYAYDENIPLIEPIVLR